MSAEPKRVELTEAETGALWVWWSADFPAPSILCETVANIVAAREAAARREALLEAEAQQPFRVAEANRVRAEKAEAKVARVEALAEEFRKSGFTSVYESAEEIAELIDRALAEPERDKEGGR